MSEHTRSGVFPLFMQGARPPSGDEHDGTSQASGALHAQSAE